MLSALCFPLRKLRPLPEWVRFAVFAIICPVTVFRAIRSSVRHCLAAKRHFAQL